LSSERPLIVTALEPPPELPVLCLAPHPDDFDAIGVTLHRLHANGNPLHVAVLCTGASGVDDRSCPGAGTPEAKAAVRMAEQRASAAWFGLPTECLRFLRLEEDAAGELADTPSNRARVREAAAERRPGLVFMPCGRDTNPGHRHAYALWRAAASALAVRPVVFLNEDPKTTSIRRDVCVLFDEPEARWKADLLRFHRSQHARNLAVRGIGLDARILSVNRRAAELAGCPGRYAEAFEVE
jgi:LmbE family N-acetylglucosaminyl deacetylase